MKNEKIDARKIDTKAQQEKRNIAMKLREKGMKSSYLNWLSSVKFEEKIEMLHSVTVA